jgi:hypothetical protein
MTFRTQYTKKQAIALFKDADVAPVTAFARAFNVTPQAVRMMPDKLPERKSLEVLGWVVREGIKNGTLMVKEVE